jgi:hypothetical protein
MRATRWAVVVVGAAMCVAAGCAGGPGPRDVAAGASAGDDASSAPESEAARKAAEPAVADWARRWVKGLNTGEESAIERVVVRRADARGAYVRVYLRRDNAIGRAAARDPAATEVDGFARISCAGLWSRVPAGAREVSLELRLGEKEVGTATSGYLNGKVVTLYVPASWTQ